MTDRPMLILIAGPYRSGAGGERRSGRAEGRSAPPDRVARWKVEQVACGAAEFDYHQWFGQGGEVAMTHAGELRLADGSGIWVEVSDGDDSGFASEANFTVSVEWRPRSGDRA
ncbi:hypothetical protein ACFU7Y_04345 [Kitasatospora sp. NPDC057542]|uniref:hypothetical protein n=1 Tax=Kitasatospora sp. NPDC057542 TaxID=3346162 RepID=UPI00368ABC87